MNKIGIFLIVIALGCSQDKSSVEQVNINSLASLETEISGDFGIVETTSTKTFNIKNNGDESSTESTVLIEGTHSSDYLIVTNSCNKVLKKKESCQVRINFNSKGKIAGTYSADLKIANLTIPLIAIIQSNESDSSFQVLVGGVIATDNVVNFGSVAGSQSSIKVVEIKNIGTKKTKVQTVAISSPDYKAVANYCTTALNPNQSCSISIVFSGSGKAQSNYNASLIYGPLSISLSSNVGPSQGSLGNLHFFEGALEILSLDYGAIPSKKNIIKTINIVNTSATKTSPIAQATIDNSNFLIIYSTCIGKSLSTNQSCQIKVLINSQTDGEKESLLTLTAQLSSDVVSLNIVGIVGVIEACLPTEHLESSVCVSNVKDCSILPSNALAGTETWNGVSFNSCEISSCVADYHIDSNVCISDIRACVILPDNASIGTETWNGSEFGSCVVSDCNSGYNLVGGICEEQIMVFSSFLSIGDTHSCSIKTTGDSYCWGSNDSGQLGDGTILKSALPVAIQSSAMTSPNFVKISTGQKHSCGLDIDGILYCWGGNIQGQLGNGTEDASLLPVEVDMTGALFGKTISSIYAGTYHSCALDDQGIAYCWGHNSSGQLGDGTEIRAHTPVQVNMSGAMVGKTFLSLSMGSSHTCAVASDNKAYCWGANASMQLGSGIEGSGAKVSSPQAVLGSGVLSGKTIVSIGGGRNHTCAIDSLGKAYCWGRGYEGELGNADPDSSAIPVAVNMNGALSGKSIVSISGGHQHTCALTSDGKAYCWGANNGGSLGVNKATNYWALTPEAVITSGVLSGITLTKLSVGYGHSCAMDANDNVYCWGSNASGQLGNGVELNSLVPVLTNL